jgi:hypothetical protein
VDGGAGGAIDAGPDAPPCIPPFDTADSCGVCNFHCPPSDPLCELGEEGYVCVPMCTDPLVQCGSECVNLETDENHCGACPIVCPSGICQGGLCRGATAGHVVALCTDLAAATPAGSAQETLLGNAVFLARRVAVRILTYEQYARPANVRAVLTTLDEAAASRGRSYSLTRATTSVDVVNGLDVTRHDVLLVYDQSRAPAGRLAEVGVSWLSAADTFVRAGGTVVVLAGPGGRGEMDDLLTSAGFLSVTAQPSLTGTEIHNRAPADAVGIGVVTPFRASAETCSFTTTVVPDASSIFVVTDTAPGAGVGAPVVVHRVVVP